MGDLRIVYGLAYGRQNNFYTIWQGKTDGLFAQGDTSPDVTKGYLFYSNNSGATTITDFDLSHPSGTSAAISGLYEGKSIVVFFLDSNTTVAGSRVYLNGTDNTFNRNSILELVYHNSGWYEMNRSNVYSVQKPANIAGNMSLDANYVSSYLLQVTGGSPVVLSISNGVVGQRLVLMNGNSSATIAISTAGNIVFSTSAPTVGNFTVLASGVAEVIKVGANQWAINQ